MKTSDIPDTLVVTTCRDTFDTTYSALTELRRITGAPSKVAFRAMQRACKNGLIDYGVSLAWAWPTDKGLALVEGGGK